MVRLSGFDPDAEDRNISDYLSGSHSLVVHFVVHYSR